MNQPRIFVTYTPARALAPRPSRRTAEPMVAVLAGALLAGGGMHASAREDRAAPFRAQPDTPFSEPRFVNPATYLARVTLPPTSEPKAGANEAQRPERKALVTKPQPVLSSPSRDLAGFLEERGLTLSVPVPDAAVTPPDTESLLTPEAELVAVSSLTESVATAGNASEMQSFPIVEVDGQPLGAVTMRGDSIHLASLIGLMELKLPAEEFERLRDAPVADSFVGIDTLHAAGISLTIDEGGERIALSLD